MKKTLSYALVASLGFVLYPNRCRASERAGQILADASQLVSAAQEAERQSYSEALERYEEAVAVLEGITREYPSSPAARKILSGFARAGPYTVRELKERVLPFARLRASAEEDLLFCAMIFAERLESVSEKTQALIKVADAYLQAGQKEKVAGVLSMAFSAAQAIHDPSDRARVLVGVAAKAAEAGGYDQALGIAQAIDDPTWVPRALIGVAEHCAEAKEADKAAEILTQALQVAEKIEDADTRASAHSVIAGTYSEAGLVEQAVQLANAAERPAQKRDALTRIAICCAEKGQSDQALKVAEMIPSGPEKDFAARRIAQSLAIEGKCDRALEVAETIQQGHPKAIALMAIAHKYIEFDEKEKAEEVLSNALQAAKSIRGEYEIERDVLIELIAQLYAQAGYYDRALEIADPIEVHDRVWAFLRIASACAKAGLTDRACEIIPKAIAAAEERLLRYLCARVCARAGQVYAEAGQPDKARETLSRALRHATQADTPSEKASVIGEIAELTVEAGLIGEAELFSQIFQAAEAIEVSGARATAFGLIAEQCSKGGMKERVTELLSRAVQAASDIEEAEHRGGQMAWLASKFAEAGLYERALHTARDTKDAQSKTRVLTEIASVFSKSERQVDDGMRKTLHEIVSTLPFPEVEKEASELLAEAHDLIKLAQEAEQTSYADALDLYQETLVRLKETAAELEGNLIPQTQTRADSEQNPFLCALFVAGKVEDASSKDHALEAIAGKFAEVGQYDRALEVAQAIKKVESKGDALAEIVGKLAEAGQSDRALEVARSIEGYMYAKTLALGEVACNYAQIGQNEKASETLALMLQVSKTIQYSNDKNLALWRMAGKLASVGAYDRALHVAQEIEEDDRKVYALAEIAARCAKGGEKKKASDLFSQALRIARGMPRREGKTSALAKIAQRYAEAGSFDEAERVVKMIWLDVHAKALALADIAAEYWEAGQAEKASQAIDQALRLAQRVRGAEEKVNALTDIAQKVGDAGQKEKACEILARAIKAVDEADDPRFNRSFALGSIARAYADAGRFDEALSVVNSMGGAYHRDWALVGIAAALARANDFHESFRVIAMIGDLGDNACALAEVGAICLRQGKGIDDATRRVLHAIIRKLE